VADRSTVTHLLRRATFGPTAVEVDEAQTVGVAATVARLLRPSTPDRGAAATPLPRLGPDPYANRGGGLSREEKQRAKDARKDQIQALTQWWILRMAAADHQLTEKMVFFWHGHWATSVQKVKSAPLMLGQLETFRKYGRGDFLTLARAMLRDPALIIWLDGQRNTSRAPNENLARELMELFTLGIGAYSESDIKMGARALTGWTVDRAAGEARLVPRRHDDGAKTILGQTAAFDADSFADLLVVQEAHPRFLAARLWYRFASVEPIPAATSARLVSAYGRGRDIDAMIGALFEDEAFAATRGQLVKQPVEWLVGAVRQLGITDAGAAKDKKHKQYTGALHALGQVPLRPPSVGGWPAGAAWLTTSSALDRLRTAVTLASAASESVLKEIGTGKTGATWEALARVLAVDAWTDRTRAAMTEAAGNPRRVLAVALASPEYTVT
jgi:uncharacterized protein (DUF1800 family)